MAQWRAKRIHRAKAGLQFEHLESRLAMAGVVINEFVAENASGLIDQDSEHSDWIELKNTDAAPVDITGWYLTDDATNLTKWQLPSTILNPGQYLVIFASDKDRDVAGQELHTNFRLSQAGEYLGLVMADGVTIAHDYAPFPQQSEDVSYGIGASASSSVNIDLVGDNAQAFVVNPAAQDAGVDDFWREITYNDDAWITTTTGVGYDRDDNALDPYIGAELTVAQMPSGTTRTSAYVRVPFTVADKDQLTSLTLELRYDDGFIGYLNGREFVRRFFEENDSRPQPQWDSRANGNRPDAQVIVPVTFDLTPYLGELLNGDNVLAFHGVNSTSQNTDFLIDPILKAQRATSTEVGYMEAPTPGANNGVGTLGFVDDTQFSVDRGFYDAAFNLEITTATPGATIRYTLDGTTPTGSNGTIYSGPINISTTSTVRAIAYKTGFTSTNVDTQTYIFLDDVLQQTNADLPQFVKDAVWGHDKDDPDTAHNEPDWDMDPDIVNSPTYASTIENDLKAIPTVSVVMDWADLFGSTLLPGSATQQGIYLAGKSDERATSVEYFTADGLTQYQIDAAIEMQGHSSTTRWNSDKMSFQLKFKSPYGPTDFDAALFGGIADGQNATTEFDTLILDAGYNYSWIHQNPVQHSVARYVTDQVVSDLQNLAGGNAPHGKYVHLYINGMYWGLYNLHERPDEAFADAYFGGSKDDYDVIKHNPTPDITWAEGGVTALNNYNTMLAATNASYAAAESLIDIDAFIDYMIVHYYAGNNDWAHNNWYASRNRVEPGGKWRFHAWDQEHAFPTSDNGDSFDVNYDSTTKDDPSAPTAIHNNLMAFTEYKVKFADHVQKLMQNGGLLTPASAAAVYQARVDEIDRAIVGESARWGDNRAYNDPYTRADWDTISDGVIANFFPLRTGVVLNQFTARGWLQSLVAPVFNNYGGEVANGFDVTITKPGGSPGAAEIYYTLDGSDPRLEGGAANPSALHFAGPINVDISAATQIKARIKNGSDWSAVIDASFTLPGLFPVRITEIHYNPAAYAGVNAENMEFIEFTNTGSQPVDLTGMQITGFDPTPYTFGNIVLAAGQRIVVARDVATFQQVYGKAINVAPDGFAPRNLSNGGESIAFMDQSFGYDDAGGWVTSPDGGGPSLEIIDPLGDQASFANWRASSSAGGSPGLASVNRGDYDYTGDIGASDQVRWTNRFGNAVTPTLGADGNGDAAVDAADYVLWRKFFDAAPGAGGGGIAFQLTTEVSRDAPAERAISPSIIVLNAAQSTSSDPVRPRTRRLSSLANVDRAPFTASSNHILRTLPDQAVDSAHEDAPIEPIACRHDEVLAELSDAFATDVPDASLWSNLTWLHKRRPRS